MIKTVHEYMTSYHAMGYYCDDKSLLYYVAFAFLSMCYAILSIAWLLILFITAPVWIGPYLIYLTIKERRTKK